MATTPASLYPHLMGDGMVRKGLMKHSISDHYGEGPTVPGKVRGHFLRRLMGDQQNLQRVGKRLLQGMQLANGPDARAAVGGDKLQDEQLVFGPCEGGTRFPSACNGFDFRHPVSDAQGLCPERWIGSGKQATAQGDDEHDQKEDKDGDEWSHGGGGIGGWGLGVGFCVLGFWRLAFGYWPLAHGCWVLGVECWALGFEVLAHGFWVFGVWRMAFSV
ncbi:hypothetical protein [Marinoscillum sp.]|uniref:hypothetical protein n=1 Tax=Marinoscillum sp. TaxID=2024838 RepID=UPI003BA90F54